MAEGGRTGAGSDVPVIGAEYVPAVCSAGLARFSSSAVLGQCGARLLREKLAC